MNSMSSMNSMSATNKNNPHTFNMREIRKLSEPDSSESISETDEGGRTITLEVGQTLFEPATHPGFLEGKELIAGKLVSQCGPEVKSILYVLFFLFFLFYLKQVTRSRIH